MGSAHRKGWGVTSLILRVLLLLGALALITLVVPATGLVLILAVGVVLLVLASFAMTVPVIVAGASVLLLFTLPFSLIASLLRWRSQRRGG